MATFSKEQQKLLNKKLGPMAEGSFDKMIHALTRLYIENSNYYNKLMSKVQMVMHEYVRNKNAGALTYIDKSAKSTILFNQASAYLNATVAIKTTVPDVSRIEDLVTYLIALHDTIEELKLELNSLDNFLIKG